MIVTALLLAVSLSCPRIYEVVTPTARFRFSSMGEAAEKIDEVFTNPADDEVFECEDNDAKCEAAYQAYAARLACAPVGEATLIVRAERYPGEAADIQHERDGEGVGKP